jgi:hypothetical protein
VYHITIQDCANKTSSASFSATPIVVEELPLQEWGKVPTANAYADGQMSVPSA